MDSNRMGDRIKVARLQKGYTQEELGNLVGVKKAAIYKYENHLVVNLKKDTINKLATALDVNGSWLLGLNEDDNDNDVDDENIKFALFGTDHVTDEQFEEVKQFARFIKERDARDKK